MGAVDLLRDLMAEGVEFETDGQRIKWRDGGAKLKPEHLDVLKSGKAEILQFLNSGGESCERSQFSRRKEKPDTDEFEERAAICEFLGELSRADAEQVAAECQGFENVVAFRTAQNKRRTSND